MCLRTFQKTGNVLVDLGNVVTTHVGPDALLTFCEFSDEFLQKLFHPRCSQYIVIIIQMENILYFIPCVTFISDVVLKTKTEILLWISKKLVIINKHRRMNVSHTWGNHHSAEFYSIEWIANQRTQHFNVVRRTLLIWIGVFIINNERQRCWFSKGSICEHESCSGWSKCLPSAHHRILGHSCHSNVWLVPAGHRVHFGTCSKAAKTVSTAQRLSRGRDPPRDNRHPRHGQRNLLLKHKVLWTCGRKHGKANGDVVVYRLIVFHSSIHFVIMRHV